MVLVRPSFILARVSASSRALIRKTHEPRRNEPRPGRRAG